MKLIPASAVLVLALALASTAHAQGASGTMDHAEHMDHSGDADPEQAMESGETNHTHQTDSSDDADDASQMDHSQHVDHSEHSMDTTGSDQDGQSGDAEQTHHTDHGNPPDQAAAAMEMRTDTEALRDPNAYAEGEDFGPLGPPKLLDQKQFGAVLIDRLEAVESSDNSWLAFSGQAWYGGTYDRANLKLELEADSGKIEHARTELLWSHAIASFWDTQLGARFDTGEIPDKAWLAFGVQGLAPYWFHLDATLYAGENGDTAARLEAEYELLFTQRLILQPRLETNLYGQNNAESGTGSGLSDLTVGLRLRYEITRQFAPYVGIQWAGLYGNAADFARDDDMPTEVTSWVIGLHMWF